MLLIRMAVILISCIMKYKRKEKTTTNNNKTNQTTSLTTNSKVLAIRIQFLAICVRIKGC